MRGNIADGYIAGLTQTEICDVVEGSAIAAVRVVVWTELRLTELSRVASAHSYGYNTATLKCSTLANQRFFLKCVYNIRYLHY